MNVDDEAYDEEYSKRPGHMADGSDERRDEDQRISDSQPLAFSDRENGGAVKGKFILVALQDDMIIHGCFRLLLTKLLF